MTASANERSVVIAGLGLRLGTQPVDMGQGTATSQEDSAISGRVFVTELLPGGAAERSNLLRLNDEILHVDHVETTGRSVSDVKGSILGIPGTSVRIGIRRNCETFELSFVRGHTNNGSSGSPSPPSNNSQAAPTVPSSVPSSVVKGTPSGSHGTVASAPRPTPKALFRSPGSDKDAHRALQMTLHDAAKRGNVEQVNMIASEIMNMASKGDLAAIRELLNYTAHAEPELTFSWKTCQVSHSARGASSSDSPTMLYDGNSPTPPASQELDRANQLVGIIESLMDATGSTAPPPPVDRGMLRDLMLEVAAAASRIQMQEPRMLEVPSPCYVLGDLHGNLTDLQFFRRSVWPIGVAAQAGDFLFLGDFVDRGADSVPVVAYMMAQKVLNPYKWWMIRGNHETREVNGNIKTYREGSFLNQCVRIFGEDDGRMLWDKVNDFFDTLPLAARIADQIFCVHGGIPKELCQPKAKLEDINEIPCPLKLVRRGDMVHSMLWSDPIPPEREDSAVHDSMLDLQGFGLSSRGCSCFGERTLDIFSEQHRIKFVFRGHEAQQNGIGLSKSARLCTIFSTSKDHFASDAKTTCGCVLVSHGSILPIVRSSAPPPSPLTIARSPDGARSTPATQPRFQSSAVAAGKPGGSGSPLARIDGNLLRPHSARKAEEGKDPRLFVC